MPSGTELFLIAISSRLFDSHSTPIKLKAGCSGMEVVLEAGVHTAALCKQLWRLFVDFYWFSAPCFFSGKLVNVNRGNWKFTAMIASCKDTVLNKDLGWRGGCRMLKT